MDAAAVLDCGAGLCLAHRRGVFLTLLRGPISDEHVARIRRQVELVGGHFPARVAALVVLEATALSKAPSPTARAGLDALRRDLPPYAGAVAIVGPGLRATMVRLLLPGLLARAGGGALRSFDDAHAAARWLASIAEPGEAEAPAALAALVDEARARLDATN